MPIDLKRPSTWPALWVRLGLLLVLISALVVVCFVMVAPAGEAVRWGMMGGAASLVTAVGAMVFTLSLTRRIRIIARGARRFASGDLRHRIGASPVVELSHLTDALNQMAGQLNDQLTLMRTRQAEQEAIFQSMQLGVVAIDAELQVLNINRVAQQMLGARQASAKGGRLTDVVEHPALLRFAADVVAEQGETVREFELPTEDDDEPRVMRATAGRLRDAAGGPVGWVLLLSDITELRKLESMRSDFAANASHELKTPITNIKGYVETLLDGAMEEPERAREFLTIVARNADRLGAIIDDMLALTTLEREDEQEQLVKQATPVFGAVQAVCAHLRPEAEAKSMRLEVIKPAMPLWAMINQRLAEQALANLITNAIKYSPAQTTVRIETTGALLPDGRDAVEISIADQGPGIPEDQMDRIFERFYRVDKARSRQAGGTGLGLAIVKHIMRVHGGTVDVESPAGGGSTFRIRFPAASPVET
ncbi:MAG: PAS domain-containing protein [Phycisphaerales bacterium]|nr:PAS domain-containing protein [Phycisphaerales bacterium]